MFCNYCGNRLVYGDCNYCNDRTDAIENIPEDIVYYEHDQVKREQSWKTQSQYAFVISQ